MLYYLWLNPYFLTVESVDAELLDRVADGGLKYRVSKGGSFPNYDFSDAVLLPTRLCCIEFASSAALYSYVTSSYWHISGMFWQSKAGTVMMLTLLDHLTELP